MAMRYKNGSAEDSDRGIRIKLRIDSGETFDLKGRRDLQRLWLSYRSRDFDFECRYFYAFTKLRYRRDGQEFERDVPAAFVIPRDQLLRNYTNAVKKTRGSLPAPNEVGQLYEDIVAAIFGSQRLSNQRLSKGVALPDPQVVFIDDSGSDDEVEKLLDTLAIGRG